MKIIKYSFFSFLALLVDYSVYFYLAILNIFSIEVAGVIGYSVGLVLAYFLIKKNVFINRKYNDDQFKEVMLFIFSGLIGIMSTYLTMYTYSYVYGEQINEAKLFAVLTSFFIVYFFRKKIIFEK